MSFSSSIPSSPSSFAATMPSTRATTPPSSPEVDEKISQAGGKSGEAVEDSEEDEDTKSHFGQLTALLEKSAAYVKLLKQQMDEVKVTHGHRRVKPKSSGKPQSQARPVKRDNAKKRTRGDRDSDDERESKRVKDDTQEAAEDAHVFEQPALVTGATLKDYQLEGVAWMAGLYQNGISGILADEMGLGKTLQAIAFHAFLRERTPAPFMVVCPLSVLQNWVDEFHRFAPDIPVCMYHGTPEERSKLRRTQMVFEESDMWYQNLGNENASSATAGSGKATRGQGRGGGRGKGHGKGRGGNNARAEESDEDESEVEELVSPKRRGKATSRKSGRTPVKAKAAGSGDENPTPKGKGRARRVRKVADDEDDSMGVDDKPSTSKSTAASSKANPSLPPHQQTNFPVVITTYEIIIRDRAALSKYKWGFIVVDEGHRLKNIDCKLMREIKKIPAAARMVLTGTPLHNNLAELWALLNFVLPDLFGDLDAFQEWFNMHNLQAKLTSARSSQLIHSLHAVLRPFLLRRLKADVEMDLPPKKEYVLYTPLSEQQREIYDAVLNGQIRAYLTRQTKEEVNKLDSKTGHKKDIDEEEESVEVMEDRKGKGKARALRAKAKNYAEDEGDDEYFAHLEAGALLARKHKEPEKTAEEVGLEWHRKALMKKVNNMKLQNAVMQLRKVCSHPFLFDWPVDPDTLQPVVNEQLVNDSGKMMVLERLLDELFKRGHKVLLFSQFTTMLDIIEDWATEFKHWPITRIDGSTTMAERREEVRRFQESGDEPDAPRLFLLSTRAGGLGLNLVAADTVIFYDQDWNPQMDLQAQDRAHRIGQTRPVLIFRLISAHTIETTIMQRATEKRKLETLVIAKGEFKSPTVAAGRSKKEALAEMAAALLRLEGEKIQVVPNTAAGKASVISDEDLDVLLDRSPEVFVDRGKGWSSGEPVAGVPEVAEGAAAPGAKKTAFAVYEAPVHASSDVLGGIMSEDVDSD